MFVQDLLREIEVCRNEMVKLTLQLPLSNKQVVEASTKLDHLLNKYDILKAKK